MTFSRSFAVRAYECDVYGHVNNTVYVHYLQETARSAWAVLDPAAAGAWCLQFLDIEYLVPLRYGDEVAVSTQVRACDGRRVQRAFEFRRPDGGELVARASTVARFIAQPGGEPRDMPADLIAACLPPGSSTTLTQPPFPSAPPPPPGVYTMRHRVPWHDLDPSGAVNEATLLVYVEACGIEVMAAHQWPVLRASAEGFAVIFRRHQVAYRAPVYLDDELELATWAFNVRRATAVRHYAMRRLGEAVPLLEAQTLAVWVNLATGKPMRIPEGFMADFAPNLANSGRLDAD